jgi:S-adenosylhomocysteine hydrolase
MKDGAIVCNIGHFDSEIQIDALRNYPLATCLGSGPFKPNHYRC